MPSPPQKRRPFRKPPLTVAQILAWADDHQARTGSWPGRNSGPVLAAPGEVWMLVERAIYYGLRGLPGGDSLAALLARERGVPPGKRHPLSEGQILDWAREHHARTGSWPDRRSGAVEGGAGATWASVNDDLRRGMRGLPGGDSLPRLLARHFGARRRSRWPALTVEQVLAWADAYHERTGHWPQIPSGGEGLPPGENWLAIDNALRRGVRGLPGGTSLPRLLAEVRGVRNKAAAPPLTVEQIVAWARAFRGRLGRWPRRRDGPVEEAPGETWVGVEMALMQGHRGLPGGDSLARLLRRQEAGRPEG